MPKKVALPRSRWAIQVPKLPSGTADAKEEEVSIDETLVALGCRKVWEGPTEPSGQGQPARPPASCWVHDAGLVVQVAFERSYDLSGKAPRVGWHAALEVDLVFDTGYSFAAMMRYFRSRHNGSGTGTMAPDGRSLRFTSTSFTGSASVLNLCHFLCDVQRIGRLLPLDEWPDDCHLHPKTAIRAALFGTDSLAGLTDAGKGEAHEAWKGFCHAFPPALQPLWSPPLDLVAPTQQPRAWYLDVDDAITYGSARMALAGCAYPDIATSALMKTWLQALQNPPTDLASPDCVREWGERHRWGDTAPGVVTLPSLLAFVNMDRHFARASLNAMLTHAPSDLLDRWLHVPDAQGNTLLGSLYARYMVSYVQREEEEWAMLASSLDALERRLGSRPALPPGQSLPGVLASLPSPPRKGVLPRLGRLLVEGCGPKPWWNIVEEPPLHWTHPEYRKEVASSEGQWLERLLETELASRASLLLEMLPKIPPLIAEYEKCRLEKAVGPTVASRCRLRM